MSIIFGCDSDQILKLVHEVCMYIVYLHYIDIGLAFGCAINVFCYVYSETEITEILIKTAWDKIINKSENQTDCKYS